VRRFTVESKRLDIVRIQFLNPREQFRQRNSKGEMTVVCDPIFSAISGVRSPQTDHRFLFLVGPKENDIARRVAIREGQPYNFSIEFLRLSCPRPASVFRRDASLRKSTGLGRFGFPPNQVIHPV